MKENSDTAKLCHLIGFESAYFCSPVFVKIKKDILYTVLLQGMNPLPTCKLRSCYCTPILSTVAYYYYFFILLLFFYNYYLSFQSAFWQSTKLLYKRKLQVFSYFRQDLAKKDLIVHRYFYNLRKGYEL